MFKPIFMVLLSVLFVTTFQSCKKDKSLSNEEEIEKALDEFVADLQSNPPDTADVSNRVKNYLSAQADFFYGSTVTLLDTSELAVSSPYWYRHNGSLSYSDLMDTSYHINTQAWLRKPIDTGSAIWSDPYFDTGGGNIMMKTRSVPVYSGGKIIAVATTDLALE